MTRICYIHAVTDGLGSKAQMKLRTLLIVLNWGYFDLMS